MSGRPTPTGPRGSDDGEVDAWLREALRHAPDATARPSDPTSATILATARAAAREAGAPSRPPSAAPAPSRSASPGPGLGRAWTIFWDGLTRPAVAAGMASVMVATVVGLMWWDRPPDEAPSMAPPSVSQPSTPSQDAGPAAEKPAPPTADRAEQRSTPQASAFPAEPSVSGRARNEDTRLRRREAPDAAMNEVAKAERKLAAPARPAPEAPPPSVDSRVESRAERSAEPPAGRQRSTAAGPAVAPSDAAAAANALAGLTASRVDPLASLSMALARDGHRWSRPLPSGGHAEIDDAFRRWLGDVQAASRARRQPTPPGARRDEPTTDDESVVRLLRDGRVAAIVRIGEAAASLESFESVEGGTATLQRWALDPQTAARLRQTLPPR